MNFKELANNYLENRQKNGGRISAMNYIRINFDDITDLILSMKNQGEGKSYEKISDLLFQLNIKTKDGKKLSVGYINDCLIKIRKEKGLRTRSKYKTTTSIRNKTTKEEIYLSEEVYNLGLDFLNNFLKKCLIEFSKPERNFRKLNFNTEQSRQIELMSKTILNKKKYESLLNITEKSQDIINLIKFIENHRELFDYLK